MIPVPLKISESAIVSHGENKVIGQIVQQASPKNMLYDSNCGTQLGRITQQRTHRLVSLPWLSMLVSHLFQNPNDSTYSLPRVVYSLYLKAKALDDPRLPTDGLSYSLGNMPDAARNTPKYLTPTDFTVANRI